MAITRTIRTSLATLTGSVQRLLGYGIEVWGEGTGVPVTADYEPERAMLAIRRNPWVYVCLQAVATDLASLPVIAVTGEGAAQRQLDDHWLPALLANPHPKTTGKKLRKQIYADLRGVGNAYLRVWRDNTGRPFQLARIPPVPQIIQPVVADDGEIVGWLLGPSKTRLKWDEVLHMADFSFDYDASLVLGTSPIEPLRTALQVDHDSRLQAGRAARRGRLEVIASPRSDSVVVGAEQVSALVQNYKRSLEDGDGLFFVNRGVDVKTVTYTPKEGDFMEQGRQTKQEILATFQVPGVRAGDAATNYGTAKQQMRTYWEGLVGWAAIIDDELSRLAEPGVRVRHSFASVEALQTSYTERQSRAREWVLTFGMDPKVAAQYEGFLDAPVPPGPYKPIQTESTQNDSGPEVDEPRETLSALRSQLAIVLNASVDTFEQDPDAAFNMLRGALRGMFLRYTKTPMDDLAVEVARTCQTAVMQGADPDLLRAVFGPRHAEQIARTVQHALG